jgi:hypothetical protein
MPPQNSPRQMMGALQHWTCCLTPLMRQFGAFRWNVLYALLLLMPTWLRLHATTSCTMPQIRQGQPRPIQWPCWLNLPCPMTYVGAVHSTIGGALAQCPLLWHRWLYHRLPSTANSGWYTSTSNLVIAQVNTTNLAPSPPDKVPPSHPHPTPEGLSIPTAPPTLLARAALSLGMPSLAPFFTASSTPSLLPFTFGSKVFLSLGGGVAHPFCVGGPTPPPQKCT